MLFFYQNFNKKFEIIIIILIYLHTQLNNMKDSGNIENIDQELNDLMTPFHEIIEVNGNIIYLANQSAVGAPPDIWNYTQEDIDAIKENLKLLNIATIICCADDICVFPNDFTYYQIPARDTPSFKYIEYFDLVAFYINESLQYGSVMIHCNAGVSRSASALIAYFIKYLNMSLHDAIRYVKSKRTCVNVNNFYEQLEIYYINQVKN